ncbi:MAG: response regulator transcription factor [Nitrospiraceae bacterium]|nr:response regulator transcription factor [Nitrospiraceae bacterium]
MEILLVDRQAMTRDALRSLLASLFKRSTVHVAADLRAALELARDGPKVELALIDLDVRGQLDIAALSQFLSSFPGIPVVVISAAEAPKIVRRALETGAAGYITRSSGQRVIAAAVRLVACGAIYVPGEIFICSSRAPARRHTELTIAYPPDMGLTSRQADVLRLMVDGLSNKEIAKFLSISLGTVKQHVHTIHERLGTSTRAETIIAAMRRGFSPIKSDRMQP